MLADTIIIVVEESPPIGFAIGAFVFVVVAAILFILEVKS